MKVLVVGADGYMGWPLACQLAAHENVQELILLDNGITREKVSNIGGDSVLPINSFSDRCALLKAKFPNKSVEGISGSVLDMELVVKLIQRQIDTVYHLGHLRTAPYSMSSHQACVETVHNNEIGFLNLIWAVKDHCRQTRIIKLGSFGAYAGTGLKIPESDIAINPESPESERMMVPYPKFATDFYHITKANDSLFARAACSNWGLKIIDVMQSTVFGATSDYTEMVGEHTRFDYDQIYGTVLNRFVLQGLSGLPLTVYGDGQHSSGIMVLKDAIGALCKMQSLPLTEGEYRIVNGNPRPYKIIDLATMVKEQLNTLDLEVTLSVNEFDPRHEANENSTYPVTTAENKFLDSLNIDTPIQTEILETAKMVQKFGKEIDSKVIYPTLDWSK